MNEEIRQRLINVLYFQSLDNWTSGYNYKQLAADLTIPIKDALNILAFYKAKGHVTDKGTYGDKYALTPEGIEYVEQFRKNRKFVTVTFFDSNPYDNGNPLMPGYYFKFKVSNKPSEEFIISVQISNILSRQWNLIGPMAVLPIRKLLFHIAKTTVESKIIDETLKPLESLELTTANRPSEIPFNPDVLADFYPSKFEVEMLANHTSARGMDKHYDSHYQVLRALVDQGASGEINFFPLVDKIGIDKNEQSRLLEELFRGKLVDSKPSIGRSAKVTITPKGIDKVNEIEETFHLKYRKPMNPRNVGSASLDETCEVLFQMHKDNRYTVEWTKSTYDNKPSDLQHAREKMLEQGILKIGLDWQETKLKSDFWEIDSYNNAVKVAKSKSDETKSVVNNTNIHGNQNNVASGLNVNQNISISLLSAEDESKLKSYGINNEEIGELKNIIATKSNGENFSSRLMKWLTSVSSAVVARGIYDQLPNIIALVHTLGNQHP